MASDGAKPSSQRTERSSLLSSCFFWHTPLTQTEPDVVFCVWDFVPSKEQQASSARGRSIPAVWRPAAGAPSAAAQRAAGRPAFVALSRGQRLRLPACCAAAELTLLAMPPQPPPAAYNRSLRVFKLVEIGLNDGDDARSTARSWATCMLCSAMRAAPRPPV